MAKEQWKVLEKAFKEVRASANSKVQNTLELATKHGVPLVEGKFLTGCPGIMNPHDTVDVELQWSSGFHNEDKTGRYNQFAQALEAIEAFSNDVSDEANQSLYIKLNVYGRAMFAYIVSLKNEDVKGSIFTVINGYATEGLDMSGNIYKDWIVVEDVFNFHIAPKIEPYSESFLLSGEKGHCDVLQVEQLLKDTVDDEIEVLGQSE